MGDKMRVIIPMAGAGRRFREVGFECPKPFIKISGKTMVEWALKPIPVSWIIYPLLLREHEQLYYSVLFPKLTNRWDVTPMFLPGPTQGAACTILTVALTLPPEEPVAVMNADQLFDHDLEALQIQALEEKWDGYILTFKGEGNQWSYVREVDRTDPLLKPEYQGKWVVEVAEKRPISDQATVGFYWWRTARTLVAACCGLINQELRVKGEFYFAPAYNIGIERFGAKIKAVPVEQFIGLGTPEDVAEFEERMSHQEAETWPRR